MAICFFCKCPLSTDRQIQSNACLRCAAEELARPVALTIADVAKRVRRCWQSHSVEARTVQASGNLRYAAPSGHFYYSHPSLPQKAFRSRKEAALAALAAQ